MSDPRTLVAVLVIACITSGAASVVRYAVSGDYWIFTAIECSPDSDSCFMGDGEEYPERFAYAHVKAHAAPVCDGWGGDCPPLVCESTATCWIEYCDPELDSCLSTGTSN